MRNDYPLPNISKIDSGYVAELARLVSIVNKKNASSHPNFLEKVDENQVCYFIWPKPILYM